MENLKSEITKRKSNWKRREWTTSDLPKKYYFPIVEGSNYGGIKKEVGWGSREYPAFVRYTIDNTGITKISSYSQEWNSDLQAVIEYRKGYHMSGMAGSDKVYKRLVKANKYLNRQYRRIEKWIEKSDLERATSIWRELHRRSELWTLVLVVRKLPFLTLEMSKVKKLIKTINKLMKEENADVKIKRLFLAEYNPDGSVKKHRPLGVPSLEWRVIAASYEFLLVNVWSKSWAENQYACMPGKGVTDAWLEILTRLSGGDVTEVIGYDLAKFFDLVYISNINEMLEELPDFLSDYFMKLVRRKAEIRNEDQELELRRLKAAEEERSTENLNMHWYNGDPQTEAPYTAFPQGLNTSPIMCCRALQMTGAISHSNVVQYVDDGIILNTNEKKLTLEQFKDRLGTGYSGIALSEKKSEMIMENGKYLKPLKFLGCTFDGETLRGHSRRNGPHEAVNATRRTQEIMEEARILENGLSVTNKPELIKEIMKAKKALKKKLAYLIAESCDPAYCPSRIEGPRTERGEPPRLDKGTEWDLTHTRKEIISGSSVEAQLLTLTPEIGEMMNSTNTVTMLGSYYLTSTLRNTRTQKITTENYKVIEVANIEAPFEIQEPFASHEPIMESKGQIIIQINTKCQFREFIMEETRFEWYDCNYRRVALPDKMGVVILEEKLGRINFQTYKNLRKGRKLNIKTKLTYTRYDPNPGKYNPYI